MQGAMERSTIKWLHKRGYTQQQIAEMVGRDPGTVRRVLEQAVDHQYEREARGSQVDVYEEWIERWLEQRLPVKRMLELAREEGEPPYRGGKTVFYEKVRAVRARWEGEQGEVALRFEGLPGEYLQLDWGELPVRFLAAGCEKVYFLACRLKYSRYMWVEFHDNMRVETLIRGQLRCFEHLGGVPWVVVYDNMKTVTSGRDQHNQPILQEAFAQFAIDLDFHPLVCAIRAPQQKGTVENLVRTVKGGFFKGRQFVDGQDLRRQGASWLQRVNQEECQANEQLPVELLPEEQAQFGALTTSAAEYGFLHLAQASWSESLVTYQTNRYSVPVEHRGQQVVLRVQEGWIRIFIGKELIAEHERCAGRKQRVIDPEHLAAVLRKKPRGRVMLYRDQLLRLGPPVSEYVAQVSRRYRTDLGDQVLGLYELWQEHGDQVLIAAVGQAQEAGAYGVEYLRALLAPAAGSEPTTPIVLQVEGAPSQQEVDRPLAEYEFYVQGAHPQVEGNGQGGSA